MQYCLDTNILLRFLMLRDPHYATIREALRLSKANGEKLFTLPQNISEFWNACTRPLTARGGLGLTVEQTTRRLRMLERHFNILPDDARTYHEWKNLVIAHSVMGVQVYDARIVAAMNVHGLTHILTLNGRDFIRYQDIVAVNPQDIINAHTPPTP